MLTTKQCFGTSMSKTTFYRLVAEGLWTRLEPGVVLTRPGEPDWPAKVWAGSLIGGEDAVIGAGTALAWHRLLDPPHGPVTIYVPRTTRLRDRSVATFVRGSELRKAEAVRGLRTSSVSDAIVDSAPELSERDLEGVIARAAQRNKLSSRRLQSLLATRRGCHKRAIIRLAACDTAAGAHSVLELDYLRLVERAHGLPRSTRQDQPTERAEYRDARYGAYGLIVELDGRDYHVGEAFRDRRRDNRNTRDSEATLRYGAPEVSADACGVAAEVAGVLSNRGWTGTLKPCPSCLGYSATGG